MVREPNGEPKMNRKIGTLLISLDFELIWGIRDFSTRDKAKDVLTTRQVVPRMLKTFEEFGVHATWATVGFLFFSARGELLASLPDRKPGYTNRALSPYENLSAELGMDEDSDPIHFAPSLILQILNTPHQELATHTFSHYYCLEEGQTADEFEHDLKAAIKAARKFDGKLKSIVFPRNQYSDLYLDVCARNGILAYRGTENLWFRRSSRRRTHRQWSRRAMRIADAYINISGANIYPLPEAGILPVNLPSSRYMRSYSKQFRLFEPLRLKRITSSMTEAAMSGQVFHLWWHPEDFSTHTDQNFQFLRGVLSHYLKLREQYGMMSLTMQEAARLVLQQ